MANHSEIMLRILKSEAMLAQPKWHVFDSVKGALVESMLGHDSQKI